MPWMSKEMTNTFVHSRPVAHILIVGGNSLFDRGSTDPQSSSVCPNLESTSVPSDNSPSLSFGAISSNVDLADVTNDRVVKYKMRPTDQVAGLHKITTGSHGLENQISTMGQQLERIETMVAAILNKQKVQEWYTTKEIALMFDKAEHTVREWCRNGRIHAEKQGSGRGASQAWVVSHAGVQSYQKVGLLPPKKP
jgi:hypothetical protein